jgi:5-methylcytosine-specific restriction endonuclease McrA
MKKRNNKIIILREYTLGRLYTSFNNHRRLSVFAQKGTECVKCGRIGTRLIRHDSGRGGIHVDLYTEDLVLMTVDHIIPKAKYGDNGEVEMMKNKQPMCSHCNGKKADKISKEIEILLRPHFIVAEEMQLFEESHKEILLY